MDTIPCPNERTKETIWLKLQDLNLKVNNADQNNPHDFKLNQSKYILIQVNYLKRKYEESIKKNCK